MKEKSYWNPIKEKKPREEIEKEKLKKLRATIKYAYQESPFYHKKFDEAGIKPEDINKIEDMKKIPIFRKDEIREERDKTGDPFGGLLCISLENTLLINPSTGTTGIPTFVTYSDAEMKTCTEMMCRHWWMAQVRPGDKAMSAQLNWHWNIAIMITAYRTLGVRTLFDFVHPDVAERYVWLAGYKPDVMMLDQPLIMAIRDEIREHTGKEPHELYGGLKTLICGGEPFPPKFKKHLMNEFGIVGDVYDLWGVSESHIEGVECEEHAGVHFWEDMFHVDIIDPDTGENLEPEGGESGEIVVTSLFARDMPFIRYATEDVAFMEKEKCNCGRTHARLILRDRIPWRVNIKGKDIFPIDVRGIIEDFPETVEGAFTIRKYSTEMDTLKIDLHPEDWVREEDKDELSNRIKAKIKEKLGIDTEIRWVSFAGLPVVFHKIERVIDEIRR